MKLTAQQTMTTESLTKRLRRLANEALGDSRQAGSGASPIWPREDGLALQLVL